MSLVVQTDNLVLEIEPSLQRPLRSTMNFIRSSSRDVTRSVGLLSAKSSPSQQCHYAVLKRPKKIKGVIEPMPYKKVELIDGVNQPEFLRFLKPTVPYHGVQNIQIKGYDHVTLDQFKTFIIRVLRQLDIKMKGKWNTPSQELSLDEFQDESYGVQDSTRIHIFERNVQIDELPSYKAHLLLETLMLSKPPGVRFAVVAHHPNALKKLYMIDVELEKAKAELKDWQRPVEELARTKKIL